VGGATRLLRHGGRLARKMCLEIARQILRTRAQFIAVGADHDLLVTVEACQSMA
jgi:hypothetical protein